jgi:Putative Ig domain
MLPRQRFAVSVLAALVLMIGSACLLLPFYPPPDRTRQPLVIEPGSLPPAQKGAVYEAGISVSEAETPVIDFYIAEGALPDGLTIEKIENENGARITGVPSKTGTFKFTVLVQCYGTSVSGQQAKKEYTLVVGE